MLRGLTRHMSNLVWYLVFFAKDFTSKYLNPGICLQALSEEVLTKESDYKATMSCGEELMTEVLEDKSFTSEQLEEMAQRWKECRDRLAAQKERLEAAKKLFEEFTMTLPDAEALLEEAQMKLDGMDPVSRTDLATAELQETEMEVGFPF